MSSGEQKWNVFWVTFNIKISNIQRMPLEQFLRLKIQYEQYYNAYKYVGCNSDRAQDEAPPP